MKLPAYLFLITLLHFSCRPKEEKTDTQFAGKPAVPASIIEEHEDLLKTIRKFTLLEDSTGLVAIKLEDLMKHHFSEEEDYVLPQLSYLPLLIQGAMPGESPQVVALTGKLKAQMNHISAEHQLIKAYTKELLLKAAEENHPEVLEFEKELSRHAASEEEILIPAAILVGEYLDLKIKSN